LGHNKRIERIKLWEFNSSSPYNTGNKYDLLYEHKRVLEHMLQVGNYTSVIYAEDDSVIPWSHLLSWAVDAEFWSIWALLGACTGRRLLFSCFGP
jgi:hypothetical protein